MTKQITTGYGAPSLPALEDRVHLLETRVNVLTEAVRILSSALAGTPLDEPGGARAIRAARQAHELLISISAGGPPSARG